MLHVIFLILKIIGIILALLIGLIVLLMCIILFAPIRYQVNGEFVNTVESIRVSAKFSWIFHLIRGTFDYQDSNIIWQIRIAWKKLNTSDEQSAPSSFTDEKEVQSHAPRKKPVAPIPPSMDDTESIDIPLQESFTHSLPVSSVRKEEAKEEKESIFKKIQNLYNKIINAIKNIKYTIVKLCDNIKMLLTKKDKIMGFVTDDIHKVAFIKLKNEVFKFIKKLKPKKFIIKGIFGFEDPCTTGQVLAGLSILYPFIATQVQLMPDFENRILTGEVFIKGRIRLVYILVIAIRLLVNKDVRKTIKDIKKLNLRK